MRFLTTRTFKKRKQERKEARKNVRKKVREKKKKERKKERNTVYEITTFFLSICY
jgi:hypothetical protein